MEIDKRVPNNTITRDLAKLSEKIGNSYETTLIIAKRANQISTAIKQELKQKLDEFSTYADTIEETYENKEQIEISKYYERLPKPSLIAIDEFENDKLYIRKIEE
ncbi:MAG: DNA-directed RNA polymerase subunit omega [Bacteroidales bacterium]